MPTLNNVTISYTTITINQLFDITRGTCLCREWFLLSKTQNEMTHSKFKHPTQWFNGKYKMQYQATKKPNYIRMNKKSHCMAKNPILIWIPTSNENVNAYWNNTKGKSMVWWIYIVALWLNWCHMKYASWLHLKCLYFPRIVLVVQDSKWDDTCYIQGFLYPT